MTVVRQGGEPNKSQRTHRARSRRVEQTCAYSNNIKELNLGVLG